MVKNEKKDTIIEKKKERCFVDINRAYCYNLFILVSIYVVVALSWAVAHIVIFVTNCYDIVICRFGG